MAGYAVISRMRHVSTIRQGIRTYLSSAYKCEEAWNSRLTQSVLKNLKQREFYYEIDRKNKFERKMHAIDIDLFINSMDTEKLRRFKLEVEDIMHRLRRSKDTINTLPSTIHTTVRLLLESQDSESILRMVSDPLRYGVFLDEYLANMLMDYFLEQQHYLAAARIASTHMLQEDFGGKLTQAFCLLSSLRYAENCNKEDWEDLRFKQPEPEEEVKVRVGYLRNPNFDDHFDLTDGNHIVGKTLAWLAMHIEGKMASNAEVLGWAMYNKWEKLTDTLQSLKDPIANYVVERVKTELEGCDDDKIKGSLLGDLDKLKESGKIEEVDLFSVAEEMLNEAIVQEEKLIAEKQEKIYHEWLDVRLEKIHEQTEQYEKDKLLQEIKEKKMRLKMKEQALYFFENRDKLEFKFDSKTRKPRYTPIPGFKKKLKIKKLRESDVYVPPEIVKRGH